jgi:hypothetical protein
MTKTNITAEPGKQEIVITRVFEAPRASWCSRHTPIQP